jgi:hypothetical protein
MRGGWNRVRCARYAVAGMLIATGPAAAQDFFSLFKPPAAGQAADAAGDRQAYEAAAEAYWQAVIDKRRARNAKRRQHEPVGLDDYVLMQPPVYSGPPASGSAPQPSARPKPDIPVIADFLKAAAAEFGFVPDRPQSEIAFKTAYGKAAAAAGLTREQVVGIYAFETGGNGTYDVQAGLTSSRPGAKAISPAIGYNQLLSTNTVGLLAEDGDRFIARLHQQSAAMTGEARRTMLRKIAALRRMVMFARSVPNAWNEHDRLAKTTAGGIGLHAAVLDRDLGPLLQVQKLLNSVQFARAKGYTAALTAAELELMNFTGDGNGIDMVMMPPDLRRQVPTANFFQQSGYERNPVARRTGTVAGLLASIESKMERAAQSRGARDMAAVF